MSGRSCNGGNLQNQIVYLSLAAHNPCGVVKIEHQMNKLNVLISDLAPERTFKTKLYAFVSLLQCLPD